MQKIKGSSVTDSSCGGNDQNLPEILQEPINEKKGVVIQE
jgi:hypothetical protein